MAKKPVSVDARQKQLLDRGARRSGDQFNYGGGGRIKQREVDAAVKEAGGRGSKTVQSARDYGALRREASTKVQGADFDWRIKRVRGDKALAAIKSAVSPKGAAALMKGALRGMLSPAGVAEGVALDVAGRMAKPAREKMQDRAVERVAKKSPGTAKAMRLANENRRKGA